MLLPSGLVVDGTNGTGTLPVTIVSSVNPADASLPFELVAKVVSPAAQLFYNWTDSLGGSNTASTWELDVDVPGNLTVTLHVTSLLGDAGTATLMVLIRPALSVTLSSPLTQVDAGVPAPLFIDLAGGTPPLTVNWVPSGGGPGGNASWPTDGNYSEDVNFLAPGPGWIAVRATDALGESTVADELVTEVVPSGSIALATNGSVGEVGWPLGIAVALEVGAPPFHWSLASSLPLTSGEIPFGIFPSDGTFRWNVSFAFSGLAILNLTAFDAVGALLTATTAVEVEPPLSVQVTSPGLQPSTPFEVSANLSGGLAPYTYQVRLSDGEACNGTLASPGSVSAIFDPSPDENYSVEVRVTDELGQTSTSTEFVRVAGPSAQASDPPRSELPVYGGIVVLALVVVLAGLYAYLRLRRGPGSLSPPDRSALPAVRDLMKRSQIIDRETLLLLCEEAGESADAAQAALKVLIATGEVSTEPGSSNDEVLRWKGMDPLGAPDEDPR
ncbi:MAG: hypothetical protein WA688_09400 [Thermoplasmata archaeon]